MLNLVPTFVLAEEITMTDNVFDNMMGSSESNGLCIQIQIQSDNNKNDFKSNTIKKCRDGGYLVKFNFKSDVSYFSFDSWIFNNNECKKVSIGGSGIYFFRTLIKLNLKFTNCSFIDNKSNAKGGAIQLGNHDNAVDEYAIKMQVSIIDCTFTGNSAVNEGGAISIETLYPVRIEGCTKPFLATTGGSGNDYHPCAEKVTNESFETGYDHNQPTSWIAIGNV